LGVLDTVGVVSLNFPAVASDAAPRSPTSLATHTVASTGVSSAPAALADAGTAVTPEELG